MAHLLKQFLRSAGTYLWSVVIWFWEGWRGWLWVLLFVFVLGVVFIGPCLPPAFSDFNERYIRILGLALQVLGLILVAKRLSSTSRTAGLPTLWCRILTNLRSFPTIGSQKYILFADSVEVRTSVGRPRIFLGAGAGANLEARLDSLERNQQALRDWVSAMEASVEETGREVQKQITSETKQREEDVHELQEYVDKMLVGELHIEWIGVCLFLIGITLGTIPQELALWFGPPSHCFIWLFQAN